MTSNFGYLGSKTRSLGQINQIPCGPSRGHISRSADLKFGQNVCLDKISEDLGHMGSKMTSLDQFKKNSKWAL